MDVVPADAADAARGIQWRRGTTVQGSRTYAYTTTGRKYVVAKYAARRGEDVLTPKGMLHYAQHPIERLIRLRVLAWQVGVLDGEPWASEVMRQHGPVVFRLN